VAALEGGAISVVHARGWADGELLQESTAPPMWLINCSLAADAEAALAALRPQRSGVTPSTIRLFLCLRLVEEDEASVVAVVASSFRIAVEDRALPTWIRERIYGLDADVDVATACWPRMPVKGLAADIRAFVQELVQECPEVSDFQSRLAVLRQLQGTALTTR